LPWIRAPGVPPLTSTSTMIVSSSAQCSGMRPPSKRTLCEPDPRRPSVSPQSSSIVHSLRGATNSSIRGGPGTPSSGISAWPM
jgi:hypothetical protein